MSFVLKVKEIIMQRDCFQFNTIIIHITGYLQYFCHYCWVELYNICQCAVKLW